MLGELAQAARRTPRAWFAWATAMGLMALALLSCTRSPEPRRSRTAEDVAEDARRIAADRPERLSMPFAPPRRGSVVVERVAPARAELDLPPPAADIGTPPEIPEATRNESPATLRPPIARGLPHVPRGGAGGRVTLDVRVDEHGEVTDVEVVESRADSLTVAAAVAAARELRYHPALLGTQRVAVWCRQVYDVERRR